ncbi:MAG TPA: PepSY-associated TM helix domain-containing protein [Rudaea sp.]|jgi:uncharacterized iron-regulated membrane protein|uniref:PepSY-associated TM helix domain-containing protein n=1 Tax=Rudaea sp. TaxID=2136325 RepID=UPI002F938F18
MRSILRNAHKYLSLTFGLLWILQAATGVILVFRGELDDALLRGPAQPLAPAQFGVEVAKLADKEATSRLTYIMASEGSRNRFDLLFTDKNERTRTLRVDGTGSVLRERPLDYDYPAPGLFQTAHDFHETLFAGDRGKWFLGLSGTLLLSNLLLGLKLAWPARGQAWRRVLLPGTTGAFSANVYKWHRALGLMLVVPAIVIVSCGVLQEWPPDSWLGVETPVPRSANAAQTSVYPLGAALATALARYPDASLGLIEMPSADNAYYRIRLRQPGELRRVYGTTTVYVDAHDGSVLLDRDAFKLPLNEKITNAFYPIHTGEFAGLAGRVMVFCSGLSLLTMAALGASMWWTRRARQRPSNSLRTQTAPR